MGPLGPSPSSATESDVDLVTDAYALQPWLQFNKEALSGQTSAKPYDILMTSI